MSAPVLIITLKKYDSRTTDECCTKIIEALQLK
jgi:hypothetical protein